MLGKLAAGKVAVGEVVTGEIVLGKLRCGNDLTPTQLNIELYSQLKRTKVGYFFIGPM